MLITKEPSETVYINGNKASAKDLQRIAEDLSAGRVSILTIERTASGNISIKIPD